jgi:hypothetical protein
MQSLAGSRIPYWAAFVVAEQECFRTLHQLSIKDHVRRVLLYLEPVTATWSPLLKLTPISS